MPGPSMDSLPPEVLCDIFLKTLPDVRNAYPIPCSESIASPLRVSHVCRSWRELALSFRELWSYLRMDLFEQRKQKEEMVEIFDTWLARTNNGPINFMIFCHYLGSSSQTTIQDHQRAEYIFTTLIENQHRWKDVCFYSRDVKFARRFPGFNLTNMPLLTSLDLDLDRSVNCVVNLTSSSRLRLLEIRHDDFDLVVGSRLPHLEQARLCFPSHQRIESSQSVLSCLELLRNAPSLRHVSISTDHRRRAPSSPLSLQGEWILLTGIRELTLDGRFGSHLPATVVDSVTLPSLEKFTYRNARGNEKLLRFFQRSVPPLTYLCLGWEVAREEVLIDILHLLPDLQYLVLRDAILPYRFFHELTVPDGSRKHASAGDQIVCPGLSFLQLRFFYWDNSTLLEPLLAMAKSRAFILGTFGTVTYHLADATKHIVAIADIDNYADKIKLSPRITFRSLQSPDGA